MVNIILASCIVALASEGKPSDTNWPSSIDVTPVRRIVIQHDGRWPPFDTLARDIVNEITGEIYFDGQDPVVVFLAWNFDANRWMREPLIPIKNAELRKELKLPADKTMFSYMELISHEHLRHLTNELSHLPEGQKPDPLQSKVGSINSKLGTLQRVFQGESIRLIPHAQDANAAWASVGRKRQDTGGAANANVSKAWQAVGAAFQADDAATFAQAAEVLTADLATLPAAFRPTMAKIDTELRYNSLRPFHMTWKVLVVGAFLAALALWVKKKWFDAMVVICLIAGFALMTYGLSLRWAIAGRIPASNMFESLLFLSWGMVGFAIVAMILLRYRIVPLTASAMGALALVLAACLPTDQFVRPIPPVLRDTVWMSIHVPIIMVSYSVLALGVLFAHVQVIVMAFGSSRSKLSQTVDSLHYWYIHVGSILLLAGIVTGSMWAASSWGRYWGWDPKEVWSLVALLGYLTILHIRIDHDRVPRWAYFVGAAMIAILFATIIPKLGTWSSGKALAYVGTLGAVAVFLLARGAFATAVKSILCFWLILMTYLGVNYVLGIGLHSYGFGTGAMARYMLLIGAIDLGVVGFLSVVYLWRIGRTGAWAQARLQVP